MDLEVAQPCPADKSCRRSILRKCLRQFPFHLGSIRFCHGHEIDDNLSAQSANPKLAGKASRQIDVGPKT